MLIGMSMLILMIIILFSLVLNDNFALTTTNIGVDNTSIVNGSTTTYVVPSEAVIFNIDTTTLLVAGIALLVSIIVVATITGIQVLGSGLSPASVRIFIILTGYIGMWSVLSILAFSLIISIQVFGSIIYITITIAYSIGVIQKISGSE